jgi:hypothetical protein
MTDDYTKSLEETIAKQEKVIEDFIKDRENIVKMLGVIAQSSHDICSDIELLANPKNPSGGTAQLDTIRNVIKNKLIQQLKSHANNIGLISSYAYTDPSDYRATGRTWAIPIIRSPKNPY